MGTVIGLAVPPANGLAELLRAQPSHAGHGRAPCAFPGPAGHGRNPALLQLGALLTLLVATD
jgi:hypothetical protein